MKTPKLAYSFLPLACLAAACSSGPAPDEYAEEGGIPLCERIVACAEHLGLGEVDYDECVLEAHSAETNLVISEEAGLDYDGECMETRGKLVDSSSCEDLVQQAGPYACGTLCDPIYGDRGAGESCGMAASVDGSDWLIDDCGPNLTCDYKGARAAESAGTCVSACGE